MAYYRGAGGVLALAVSVFAQSPQIQPVRVSGGFSHPTHITNAGDGSNRLFVVEQDGRIRIIKNGAALATPFLDITSRVNCCGERGLLSVAFPPGYSTKNYFYVYYTALTGDITIARYRTTADPDRADPGSETVLLSIDHRQAANHNGGQLMFNPKDGYLYLGTGDGGGAGDTFGNSQNTNALLAKLLRIDVEGGAAPYGIPPSNPFVNRAGFRPEIWAWGLRNPFRFSFDRANGDLYIGDVGQNLYEEVDYQPASSGGGQNYGWNIMEGFHCFQPGCSSAGLTLPVAEYDHSAGDCAIIGGFVYRGPQYPAMQGLYFYADECTGRIWQLARNGAAFQSTALLKTGANISSFGEDEAGELYFVDNSKGDVYLLAGAAPALSGASVVNAASFEPGIVPGSVATIFGTGLAPLPGIIQPGQAPLPLQLNGVSVTVNGIAAPLLAVADVKGQQQINLQIPLEIANASTATIVVSNNGLASAAVNADVLAVQPAVFTVDGVHAAALHGTSNQPITAASPAAKGEIVAIFATGLGPVDRPPGTGNLAPASPPANTQAQPLAAIGGLNAAVSFSGLAPGTAGLYQVNVQVPANAPSGDQDLVLTIGGRSSKPAKIPIP